MGRLLGEGAPLVGCTVMTYWALCGDEVLNLGLPGRGGLEQSCTKQAVACQLLASSAVLGTNPIQDCG